MRDISEWMRSAVICKLEIGEGAMNRIFLDNILMGCYANMVLCMMV